MHAAPSCVGDIDMLRCDGKLFMNSDGKGTFTHDADQDMDPLALANIECATKLASDCAPWADPAACAACFEAWDPNGLQVCTSNDVDTLCNAANPAPVVKGSPKCGLADVNADGTPSFHVHVLSKKPRLPNLCLPVPPVRLHASLGRLALTSHPTRSLCPCPHATCR